VPKTIKRTYAFAFGGSLVCSMIAYLVVLPFPVSSRLAFYASVSQLAALLFFDFWQWSKGAIEKMADPPPKASELRPSIRIRRLIFSAACVALGLDIILRPGASSFSVIFGGTVCLIWGSELVTSRLNPLGLGSLIWNLLLLALIAGCLCFGVLHLFGVF
jgi:hypothetical protein